MKIGFAGVVLRAWDLPAMAEFYGQIGIAMSVQDDGSLKGAIGAVGIEIREAGKTGPTTMTEIEFTVDGIADIRRSIRGGRIVEQTRNVLLVEDPQGHRIRFVVGTDPSRTDT